MTETKLYDADFYRGEIARIKLLLTQSINEQERERLQNNLRVAQSYLAQHDTALRKFDACYTVIRGARPGKRIGLVKYNESGYYLTDFDWHEAPLEDVVVTVNGLNERLGIPADVVESMEDGSMFGWHVPAAQKAHEYFKQ